VPAAAVIPAPIAYIKVVAVKKLVVGARGHGRARSAGMVCTGPSAPPSGLPPPALSWVGGPRLRIFHFEKIRVLKAGLILAPRIH
jgi:hypothetical protein